MKKKTEGEDKMPNLEFTDSRDVKLVMQQTGCDEQKAIKVLISTSSDLAKTIFMINNNKK